MRRALSATALDRPSPSVSRAINALAELSADYPKGIIAKATTRSHEMIRPLGSQNQAQTEPSATQLSLFFAVASTPDPSAVLKGATFLCQYLLLRPGEGMPSDGDQTNVRLVVQQITMADQSTAASYLPVQPVVKPLSAVLSLERQVGHRESVGRCASNDTNVAGAPTSTSTGSPSSPRMRRRRPALPHSKTMP